MPARERRSVGELLADSDYLARDLLAQVSGEDAAAMLRSWPQLVGAAERLWSALPPASLSPTQDSEQMARLAGIGAGISRGAVNRRWPGPGIADRRLVEISSNLQRAATLVEWYGQDVQPTSAVVRGDIAAAQARIVHTLYVVTHATEVAVGDWIRRPDPSRGRPRTRASELRRGQLTAATAVAERLRVFEQTAGAYVSTHPVAAAALGAVRPAPAPSRLLTALSRWDVQVHRSLVGRPDLPDVVRIARVQALIAASSGVMVAAGATQGVLDRQAADRAASLLRESELAWTRLAQLSGRLVGADGAVDRSLSRSAGEVRAVIATTLCTPLGWAHPAEIGERADLVKDSRALQQSMLAAVDVAHLLGDVVASRPYLTAPARLILQRSRVRDPMPVDQVEGYREDLRLLDPRQIALNRRVPLPTADRQGLIISAEAAAATSEQAAKAVAIGLQALPPGTSSNRPRHPTITPPTPVRGLGRSGPRR